MNNWKLTNIPKKCYFYWGKNQNLSFMRYMSVLSFIKHNKDWEVFVYYPTKTSTSMTWKTNEQKKLYNGEDYFEKLKDLPIKLIEFDFSEIGIRNTIPEVFKSDMIRLHLLNKYGGLWSDMDIFYIKPISSMYANIGECENTELFCDSHYGLHSIGFLLSSKNNLLLKHMLENVEEYADNLSYQGIGAHMFKKYLPKFKNGLVKFKGTNIFNIPFETVYHVPWMDAKRLYEPDCPKYMENTIGIHWYAGSDISAEYENLVDENWVRSDIKIIEDMVKCYET